MRRLLTPLLAASLAAAATAGLALADRDSRPRDSSYAIGLWGDVPYSDVQTATGVPHLIRDMNRSRLAFSVHDGDIKSGSSRCDDVVYAQFETFLDSLSAPAFYTPGDNEWTDCDRPAAGAYDSEERLNYIRANLFDDYDRGKRRLRLVPQKAPYVENARWRQGGVVYATLHVVGSDNNLGDVAPDPVEFAARDAATIDWMRQTFDRARRSDAAGVLLTIQANPGFDLSDPTRAPLRDPRTLLSSPSGQPDGFTGFLRALREETVAFRRPVVLVHGDSHVFRIDKPLQDEAGQRLENFTRLETPGDNAQNGNNDVHWVKVQVDPRDREVFAFQPQTVPGNRVAVPAP